MTQNLKELYEYGYEIFEDKEKFHKWLERKCVALGGLVPASLLTTENGIQLVKQTIGKVEHSVDEQRD